MCFEANTYHPLGGYSFFGNVNTVVNCKEAHWYDGHERMRDSGKEKKRDRGGKQGCLGGEAGVLDMWCGLLAPCEAHEEGRGEVIVRRRWCYGEEGIKECTGFREQREARTEKEQGLREKRGINRNRKVWKTGEDDGTFKWRGVKHRRREKHWEGGRGRKKGSKDCYHLESIENGWAWRGYNHIHQQHCLLKPVLLLLGLPPSVPPNHQPWSICLHTK